MTTSFMSGRCFKTCQASTCIALQLLSQSGQVLTGACAADHQQAAFTADSDQGCTHASKSKYAELHNYRCMDVPLSKAQKGHLLQESSREPHPK